MHPISGAALAQRLEALDTHGVVLSTQTKARLLPDSGALALPVADGWAVYNGPHSPINRAHGLGMFGPLTPAHFDELSSFYLARGMTAELEATPYSDPSLLELARSHNFQARRFMQVWWRALDTLDDLPPAPAGVRVEALPAARLDEWVALTEDADFAREVTWPTAQRSDTTCFLAWLGDRPAGGGAVAMQGDGCLLYYASTRPELRRMGVQTALLAARLRYAQAAGCRLAVVHSSPATASERNVQRGGFRLAYSRVSLRQQVRPG